MRPTRREAIASLAGLPALAALEALPGCRRERVARPPFEGQIVGADVLRGHRIRSAELLSRKPVRRDRLGTAILGGGISGLAAAWTLARAGNTDFRVYELEDAPGGNARSAKSAVSAYPWGAHYVPVPVEPNPALERLLEEIGAVEERDSRGRIRWAESMLCHEPEERLFFRGLWWEGLYPRAGASPEDLAELRRFESDVQELASRRDSRGRRAFALPRRLSSPDAEWTVLDHISMEEWLARRGTRSERLRWFVEYACRDDFGSSLRSTSAWAGLHYFASRLPGVPPGAAGSDGADEAGPAAFLTWPEGNGRLVSHLGAAAAGRLLTGSSVFDVRPGADGVEIRYHDASTDEVIAVDARHAVFALPKLLASRIVAPWRDEPPAFLSAFSYAPWLVANLTLREHPAGRGFPLAWDNVLHGSRSLGYVVATHQTGRGLGPTVVTYYLVFPEEEPSVARQRLLGASWSDLAAAILADLAPAHPDLVDLVTRLDVVLWGHGMGRPTPGFVWGRDRELASRPLGRLRFAHADISGLPLFEEALDAGVRAAESILEDEGTPFSALTGT